MWIYCRGNMEKSFIEKLKSNWLMFKCMKWIIIVVVVVVFIVLVFSVVFIRLMIYWDIFVDILLIVFWDSDVKEVDVVFFVGFYVGCMIVRGNIIEGL